MSKFFADLAIFSILAGIAWLVDSSILTFPGVLANVCNSGQQNILVINWKDFAKKRDVRVIKCAVFS
jgi:hypothetical protein